MATDLKSSSTATTTYIHTFCIRFVFNKFKIKRKVNKKLCFCGYSIWFTLTLMRHPEVAYGYLRTGWRSLFKLRLFIHIISSYLLIILHGQLRIHDILRFSSTKIKVDPFLNWFERYNNSYWKNIALLGRRHPKYGNVTFSHRGNGHTWTCIPEYDSRCNM